MKLFRNTYFAQKYGMTSYDHFLRLCVLIGLILGGLMATALVSALLMVIDGMTLTQIMEMGETGSMNFSTTLTRSLLAIQHLLFFIGPGLVFGLIFYKKNFLSGLDLSLNPGMRLSVLGIFFLLAAYPLVNLSFLVNESIPLPSWAVSLEDQAADTLKAILTMDTPWIFIANLFIIAILPGIGEELIFRGILQKHLGFIFKNPLVGIWLTAFIFSAIHLQFEGFLPRMVLGVVLGYLYFWTRNLWVPIIAHAFNNGIQVILIYLTNMDLSNFDEQSSSQLKWWMLPLSILFMYFIYTSIIKNHPDVEQA